MAALMLISFSGQIEAAAQSINVMPVNGMLDGIFS
jgi:hypothetical protein